MVLAILLYEQLIHHTQIILCPNMQFLSAQHGAYRSYSSYFTVSFHLHCCGTFGEFGTKMFP